MAGSEHLSRRDFVKWTTAAVGAFITAAIALPALLLLLTAFGPIGWLLGAGAAVVLALPWLVGLGILWFLRHIA